MFGNGRWSGWHGGLVVFVLFLPLVATAQREQVLDAIAAVVDEEIILQSEVVQGAYLLALQAGLDPARDPVGFERLKRATLDNLIAQKILLVQARAETIKVDEAQVDQLLEQQMKMLVERFGSEDKVAEYFGQPIAKVRRSYREEIYNNLLINGLQQEKFRNLKVTRREVEEFYRTHKDSLPTLKESVSISHILVEIKPGPEADRRAYQRAEEIRSRILKGEDFGSLAKQYSEDPGSAGRGGELGLLSRGDFVPEFEEAAFALQPGQISEVVKTRFGYHVIQCIDKRGDKINVRHILIAVPILPEDERAALQKAEDIRRRIVEGGDSFEEMARQFSDDEETKTKGGYLGWFELDKFAESAQEFRAVAETLRVGEISAPFKTRFGYHIVKMNDRQEARPLSLEKDWDKIEAMALEAKRQRRFEEWVQELRRDIYVEIKER
ncbi:MAG: peptidylprolyl isomerase [candidate division KSB1 bacterium]|nr:peptidylprolyl isomerase [candidate division KSB1 bacterium]